MQRHEITGEGKAKNYLTIQTLKCVFGGDTVIIPRIDLPSSKTQASSALK